MVLRKVGGNVCPWFPPSCQIPLQLPSVFACPFSSDPSYLGPTPRPILWSPTPSPAIQSTAMPSTRPMPLVTTSSRHVWSRLARLIVLRPMSTQ